MLNALKLFVHIKKSDIVYDFKRDLICSEIKNIMFSGLANVNV